MAFVPPIGETLLSGASGALRPNGTQGSTTEHPEKTRNCLGHFLVIALTFVVGLGAAVRSVHAAEVTDVMDSFEKDRPFGGALRLRFESDSRSSSIAREVKCLSNDATGAGVCSTSGIKLAKEAQYERRRNSLSIDTRFGLYKDLELYAYFPIVLNDSHTLAFAPGVSQLNSTIDPKFDKNVLFQIPYNSKSRSGFGDMTLGLKWSPYNFYRDDTEPTWVFGFDVILPTGTTMRADNTGVGMGLFQTQLYSTISRRTLQYFEPFFNLHGVIKTASSDSLFNKLDAETQTYGTPGPEVGTRFGLTILPWEDATHDQRMEIEFGSGLDYIFRGREYTDIWEALGSSSNPCKPTIGCTNTSHMNSDVDPVTGQHTRTDGITDVEAYARLQTWASVHYQPVRNFQISARVSYLQETAHFLSMGDYGKDLDGNGIVDAKNKNGKNEFSPVYLPAIDAPAQRLRLTDSSNTVFMITVSGKL